MTRKNSTVNPKAGTLKPQDRALRISRQSGFVKSIAFALLLSLIAPSVTQAMGDLSDTGKEIHARLDSSIPDSCCVADDRQNKGNYKMVRLTIPSREMIRKSDSEANRNLFSSLKENKLRRMASWISRSDRDIAEQFTEAIRINPNANVAKSDTEMTDFFQAENIPVKVLAIVSKADQDMHDFFALDNNGILLSAQLKTMGDDQINRQFALDNTRISLPSASDFAKADADMAVKAGAAQSVQVVASSY